MTAIFSAIGLILTFALGVWKLFSRKNREARKRIAEAEKLGTEGIDENDVAKITAAYNRINRER